VSRGKHGYRNEGAEILAFTTSNPMNVDTDLTGENEMPALYLAKY
jgi:hypothetical protein